LWAANHRGRTELAVRFEQVQSDFPIRVRSSGRIIDAIAWPSVSAPVQLLGLHEVQIDLVPSRPTRWVSLLLEMDPPDAGLVIEMPQRAGSLRFVCGNRSDIESPSLCAQALEGNSAADATLSDEGEGWVRIVRHAGPSFRSANDLGEEPISQSAADSRLAAQLEALGYAGVAVGNAEAAEVGAAPAARGVAAEPGEVELVRTAEGA
jgi:hypothetical protein